MSNGKKFNHRHEQAILTLLSEPTIELAAKKAGIGAATMARWLQRPDFQTAYRMARRQAFETGLSQLQALSSAAVETLKRNLGCGRPAVEVRAASAVLEHARDGAVLLDLSERLTAVEHLIHKEAAT